MKTRLVIWVGLLLAAAFVPARASTLAVTASSTVSGGLYNYTYNFTMTGGNVDNLYLGSGDLSPLSLSIFFDNTLTTAWSWLGNNTPQDYLQFFRVNGSFLTPADSLRVTFTSSFAPSQNNFAVALNGSTGETSATVNNVLAPGVAPAAVPEPEGLGLTVVAAAFGGVLIYFRKRLAGQR